MAQDINSLIGSPKDYEETLKLWQSGIVSLDPAKVSKAIQRGIDVDTSYASYAKGSPLKKLLTEHSYLYSDVTGSVDSEEKVQKRQAIRDITHLILDEDPDLLAEVNNFGTRLADNIMANTHDKDLAADVAIKAIYDHARHYGEPLSINYNAIFAGLGSPEEPYDKTREKHMNSIEEVCNRIAAKLDEPDTLYAQQLKGAHPDTAAQWMQPFERPDLGELPTPSREFIDAVAGMGEMVKRAMPSPDAQIDSDALRRGQDFMRHSIRAEQKQRSTWGGPPGTR